MSGVECCNMRARVQCFVAGKIHSWFKFILHAFVVLKAINDLMKTKGKGENWKWKGTSSRDSWLRFHLGSSYKHWTLYFLLVNIVEKLKPHKLEIQIWLMKQGHPKNTWGSGKFVGFLKYPENRRFDTLPIYKSEIT